MTTQKLITEAKRSIEAILNAGNDKDMYMWTGHALAFLEMAQNSLAADAEALKVGRALADLKVMGHFTVRDDLTDEEKTELIKSIQNGPIQALEAGENE